MNIEEIVNNFTEKIKDILTRIENLGGKINFDPKENDVEITMDYYDYQKLQKELIPIVNFKCSFIGPKIKRGTSLMYMNKDIRIAIHNIGEFKFILKVD